MSPITESKAGVGPIEGAFYALCSAALWVVYSLFVFVVACLVVDESGDGAYWGGWAFLGAVLLVPFTPLVLLAAKRLANPPFIPATMSGRTVFFVQVAGSIALIAAVLAPLIFLWSFFNPQGEVSVSNQSQYTYRVELTDGGEYAYCSASNLVESGNDAKVSVNIDEGSSIECWGRDVEDIRLYSARGMYVCDWPIPSDTQPIILRDDGPSCEVISRKLNEPFNPSPPFAEPGP